MTVTQPTSRIGTELNMNQRSTIKENNHTSSQADGSLGASSLDLEMIRKDFPIISNRLVHDNKRLVYLDNAATSQKPASVIEALSRYYSEYNSNVHRGLHLLSEEATEAFEGTRERVRAFIDAASTREIIFTKGTTEAINLVLNSWARENINAGDEIVISAMEHHSNFVPWQMLAESRQAKLRFIELTANGTLDLEQAAALFNEKTKLLAVTQMSNVLGTITPLKELIAMAKAVGAKTLVDGAQGVPHLPTSVRELDCDFLAFSFHKMLGPTGVGVLYGKEEILNAMPPFMYGGDMISAVHRDRTRFNELPWKFEAGTPNIADVIASSMALEYLSDLGMDNVRRHEIELTTYALEKMSALEGMTIYGPKSALDKGGVISFNFAGIHPHDIGQILDESGIAVRAGHHCCQPLMDTLEVQGTARASFYLYNTTEEVDLLVDALIEAQKVFGHVPRR